MSKGVSVSQGFRLHTGSRSYLRRSTSTERISKNYLWQRPVNVHDTGTCSMTHNISPGLITTLKPTPNRVVWKRVVGQLKIRFLIIGNCWNKMPQVGVCCQVFQSAARTLMIIKASTRCKFKD